MISSARCTPRALHILKNSAYGLDQTKPLLGKPSALSRLESTKIERSYPSLIQEPVNSPSDDPTIDIKTRDFYRKVTFEGIRKFLLASVPLELWLIQNNPNLPNLATLGKCSFASAGLGALQYAIVELGSNAACKFAKEHIPESDDESAKSLKTNALKLSTAVTLGCTLSGCLGAVKMASYGAAPLPAFAKASKASLLSNGLYWFSLTGFTALSEKPEQANQMAAAVCTGFAPFIICYRIHNQEINGKKVSLNSLPSVGNFLGSRFRLACFVGIYPMGIASIMAADLVSKKIIPGDK